MARHLVHVRVLTSAVATAGLVGSLLVAVAAPAAAAPAPVLPVGAGMTADALPTVQVNGVVWSQVVVGNTVYAGAIPAGGRTSGAGAVMGTHRSIVRWTPVAGGWCPGGRARDWPRCAPDQPTTARLGGAVTGSIRSARSRERATVRASARR